MAKFVLYVRVVFFALILLSFCFVNGQNVVNNGDGIVINSGAYLVIGGDYINHTATQDGFVDLDGSMLVYDDFLNYANNDVFINVEAIPDGLVLMPSAQQQTIGGSHETGFENLHVVAGTKLLDFDKARVEGVFTLASVFDLNRNTLEITKSNTAALHYVSGYLYAETDPIQGLGVLRWHIDDKMGFFYVPFGSGLGNYNDLDLMFAVQTPAVGNGYVDFSTYPTPPSNAPLPDNVTTLAPFTAELTIDRFWLIDAQQAQKPSASIEFSYTQSDCNGIKENTLKAIRFNDDNSTWDDWGPDGQIDISANTLLTSQVASTDLYKSWTLTGQTDEDFIFVPNTFSPNHDGENDYFYPIIGNEEISEYVFRVFDRWGTEIFYSTAVSDGWDGFFKTNECQQDVYVYILEYRSVNGEKVHKYGHVNLIR